MRHPRGFSPLTPGVSACRCENQELRRMVTLSNQESAKREAAEQQQVWAEHRPRAGLGRGQAEIPMASSQFSPVCLSRTGATPQGVEG